MQLTIRTTREDHRIAWLAALAITIHIAESVLPSPIPGIKPGLANVVTIIVLILFGWSSAAWVALLRVLIGSLLIGSFLSPTFILSLGGAIASVAAIGVATRIPGVGPVGYSVLAAMAHMAAQFWIAYTLFVPHDGLFRLLPVFMTTAVVTGLLGGFIARAVLDRLDEPDHGRYSALTTADQAR